MINVSILIPVFNNLSFTKICLQNLYSQIKQDDEIHFNVIVIDDGSKDGTKDWVTKNFPQVILLEGDGNLWWSGGINEGARYSVEILHADYVLLWNNDVCSDVNYFVNLKEVIKNNTGPAIIGSKVYLDPEYSRIWTMGGYFDTHTGEKRFSVYNTIDGPEYQEVKEVDWLPGMGTLVPAEIIKKIGYWDNIHFPQYHGDSDFTLRARKYGYKVLLNPTLKMWNDNNNTGLWHKGRFDLFFKSLFHIRSNFNIAKDIKFYKIHTDSIFAYKVLIKRYLIYAGSFVKWFFIRVFRIKNNRL